ncbi:MAG: hypothetical protein ACXWZR_05890 [Mycobacterium sp.]
MTTPAELTAPIAPVTAANAGWRQRKWGLIRLASPIVLVGLWQLASAVGLISQDVLRAAKIERVRKAPSTVSWTKAVIPVVVIVGAIGMTQIYPDRTREKAKTRA